MQNGALRNVAELAPDTRRAMETRPIRAFLFGPPRERLALPRELLEIILAGPHELVLAEFVLEETSRVLRNPRMQNFYKLSSEDIAEHVELLRASSDLVSPTVHHPVVLNDSNDDPVVYTAVNGRADISVP